MVKINTNDGCLSAELLTTPQAAALLQMHPVTLSSWRQERKGPPYLKIGGKVRYPKHLLLGWASKSLIVAENERVA